MIRLQKILHAPTPPGGGVTIQVGTTSNSTTNTISRIHRLNQNQNKLKVRFISSNFKSKTKKKTIKKLSMNIFPLFCILQKKMKKKSQMFRNVFWVSLFLSIVSFESFLCSICWKCFPIIYCSFLETNFFVFLFKVQSHEKLFWIWFSFFYNLCFQFFLTNSIYDFWIEMLFFIMRLSSVSNIENVNYFKLC